MSQTIAQRRNAARELGRRLFPAGVTANLNLDDLTAAIGSVDDMMDLVPSGLTVTRTIKQNFIDNLPERFKSNSNAQQKALVLAVWALQEVGLI